MQKRVVLFTAPNCKWCVKAKRFLKQKNIKFTSIDISKNYKAMRDCQKHGCRGVPVVLIGDDWICGFDEKKIQKSLKG